MKRINLAILLSLSFISYVLSQTEVKLLQDPAAEPVLDKVSTTLSSDRAYNIEFRYEIESAAEQYKVEDFGSIIIKGQKYKLKTDDGEVFYNGKRMWTYSHVNEEVYVSTPDTGNLDQMFTAPFILLNNYKQYFKYRLREDVRSGNRILYEVDLYPLSLETSFSIIKVRVDKTSGRLHSFIVQQKNGISVRILITEIITNINISDSAFNWNKEQYPDVLMIEL